MIISIIGITLYILMDIYFLIPESIKYYRDIPQLISGEYDSTKGCIETHIRRTGKNLYDISIVNGIPLKGTVSYKDEKNYKCYKFYYLSNTKWIIKYY